MSGWDIPDPSWKHGPPDPPAWTVHDHEFHYSEPHVEVMDGYVYVHQQCDVDDGHPYDAQRCEAQRTITYRVKNVQQWKKAAPEEWAGGEVDARGPHADVHDEVVRHAEKLIEDDPFQYDLLEQADFEVWVDLDVGKFTAMFEHVDTEVREW